MLELSWIAEGGGEAGVGELALARRRSRERLAWGLSIVAVTALLTGLTVWSVTRPGQPARTIMRFPLALPPGDRFSAPGRHLVALSPDGTRFVYAANNQLYLREMDQLEAAPIRGTDIGSINPFFSPDGQWVGFWAGDQLKKIAVTGGAPVTLCEAASFNAPARPAFPRRW